uniref:Uncharacterized protein n=1 Tax=Seriola dumerili TaxID=41447 RepID=A0A3B4UYI8_SERDU
MSELLVCSPAGVRRKELLVREEEEEGAGGEEEEESRRNMDVSLLREQYRSSRETQRRQTQLLLFRTDPPDDSQESSAPGSLTSSDESSTPVASVTCSPSSSTTDLHLKENRSADVKTTNDFLQTRNTPAWRGSRKFSAPALRFTRQLSVGGVGSSSGVHQNQNYYPFPSRKAPRISEAARRLGMYSSF